MVLVYFMNVSSVSSHLLKATMEACVAVHDADGMGTRSSFLVAGPCRTHHLQGTNCTSVTFPTCLTLVRSHALHRDKTSG